MNKKILLLKQQRAQKIAAMKAITDKANQEKRVKSTEELERWNPLKSEIEEINSEIETLEFEERQDAGIAAQGVQEQRESSEEKEIKRYDLSKAIREYKRGGLTGFEKEQQDEAEKELRTYGQSAEGIAISKKLLRSFTKAGNTSHASEIATGIDIIADRGLLAQLGITIYDGLTSQMKLVFGNGFSANFVDEGIAADQTPATESTGKIEPKRIQGWDMFSNEFLAQSVTMPQLMADMLGSIEAATAKKILDQILALAPLAGYDPAADAAKQLTWSDVMKLKAAVKSTQFKSPKFVAGGDLFASLEATRKDAGSGRMIIDEGRISAYQAVDMQGLIAPVADTALDADTDPTYALIFGDMSRAYAGFYSGIEILVDPFTGSDKGETKLTWHRLGDTAVNPKAFKTIKNALL